VKADIDEAAAWYSGDPAVLTTLYGGTDRKPTQARGGSLRSRFWSRSSTAPGSRQRLHAPAAADVAATSADLLFGEPPAVTIPAAHEQTADTAAKATEDRLVDLCDLNGTDALLLELAEVCAALGGVYLRPVWDRSVADHPMLDVVHADHAAPEFRWGRLAAVTFWRTLTGSTKPGDGGLRPGVWRHLERHEPGVILHGLYFGDHTNLGQRMNLADHPDTAALIGNDGPDENGVLTLPDGLKALGVDVRYIPNVRPNRRHRGTPYGRADVAGTESFMDALDETWTAWMREIRLVKPRVIVPNDFLQRAGRGVGAGFDLDQEVFSPLDIDPAHADKAGITVTEFQLHTDSYARTCAELFEKIVVTAGYSPSTFGLISGDTGQGRTATEIDVRQGRTVATSNRKRRYMGAAVPDVLQMLLIVDREVFGNTKVTPVRPRIEFGEQTDDQKTAQTVSLLRAAQAVSVRTAVRMAQPKLEGDELDAEVARILDEHTVSVADPTGGAV
jgi:hypothetical protein